MSQSHSLPSGRSFELDLGLNHPTLLPGVQVLSESTLFEGGKLLRPRLSLMMAEAIGISMERVLPYARVAELVHGATLSHDDVIDRATERREKPTLNQRTTQARAVLSGDLLLARAMVELSELGHSELLRRMAEVLEDLVTGEWLQLENRGNPDVPTITLDTIAQYKTASMLEWCTEMPVHLAGGSAEAIQLARRYGRHLGIAFQYADDCVDFSSHSGKPFAKDLSEGLINQVSRILLDRNPSLRDSFVGFAQAGEAVSEDSFVERVGRLALESALQEVRDRARLQCRLARQALEGLMLMSGDDADGTHLSAVLNKIVERDR